MLKKVVLRLLFIFVQGIVENSLEIGRGARGNREASVRHRVRRKWFTLRGLCRREHKERHTSNSPGPCVLPLGDTNSLTKISHDDCIWLIGAQSKVMEVAWSVRLPLGD
ncbi:hypothetical protein BJV78DRAFT_1224233 [Lactifluus subvellereus]|nr:hypothetical protein BJV78DRAFT_1224233 [Lactifluus subvellereus]